MMENVLILLEENLVEVVADGEEAVKTESKMKEMLTELAKSFDVAVDRAVAAEDAVEDIGGLEESDSRGSVDDREDCFLGVLSVAETAEGREPVDNDEDCSLGGFSVLDKVPESSDGLEYQSCEEENPSH